MVSEAELKTGIRRYLTSKGIYWCSIQNGFGAKPGDPDIVCCINGTFVALEVKTANGRMSHIQEQRRDEIVESGGFYIVIRSLEELPILLRMFDFS